MTHFLRLFAFLFFIHQAVGQYSVTVPTKYVCPPCDSSCDETEHDAPGVCTHCNMVLVPKNLSKTIAFYLQDGVEVLDFAGPMEVFAYAGYEVFTVSAEEKPITSQGIVTILPDFGIANAPKADILAFFGGNATEAFTNKAVIDWVKNQPAVQYYFSVCTGAFILAESGILNGKTATTFHNALDNLASRYPKIDVRKDVRFVDNGEVLTTAGISAGIDGALHLVAKLQGINAAKRTAYYMEYDNWKVGDGLLLTDENPYRATISVEGLRAYEGKYEYKNNLQFQLVYDTQEGELIAKIDGNSYPIYHENGDTFTDINGAPVFFSRNVKNEITGYRLDQKGQLYKKLP